MGVLLQVEAFLQVDDGVLLELVVYQDSVYILPREFCSNALIHRFEIPQFVILSPDMVVDFGQFVDLPDQHLVLSHSK